MRVLIAAGGTAGHINPALAIAQGIKNRWPEAEIHFAGRRQGMEYGLVTREGYPFHHIEVRGLQRKISLENIGRNAAAAWYLAQAPVAAKKIIQQVKPDLVIGAGGYVSGPVVRQAAKMKIKTAIHEQNAYPGITNKLLAKDVDLIFAPTQSASERLGQQGKTYICGNPVREELYTADREKNRQGIKAGNRLVLLSYGGSLGAMRVNEVVAELAKWHLEHRDFLHIHATGRIEKEDFAALAERLGIAGKENFVIKEFINDMPGMLAAADLVISRAGALTLAELAAAGRASVLIPSPNVAENHQYYNALEYVQAGAAELIEEKELTGEKIIQLVDELTKDKNRLEAMGKAAKKLDHPNAVSEIVEHLAMLVG